MFIWNAMTGGDLPGKGSQVRKMPLGRPPAPVIYPLLPDEPAIPPVIPSPAIIPPTITPGLPPLIPLTPPPPEKINDK